MGKVLQFAKKVGSIEPKDPEAAQAAEQAVMESFARSLREAFTEEELAEIAEEFDEEGTTKE